ncbi:hypothetical protein [Streptomyces sp. B21-083]|uniref:hypothetical protein n=1 Tax=Streptomyces sp. B21-083 TaxID=3039410 RepID=UPI002FF275F2
MTRTESESAMAKTQLRGARTNHHLARVTMLALAALIGTQWLASAAGIRAY